ncbi:sensor histidine kinase efflux regulator BaeS [Dyella caseinilytica]|uniref:histidine kinase n=1 Tax=Dyella caseinilytica TaxID=1849581 RepID=A0ABX7GU74_9GAMM|nr:sensor histidine kinase efflux regulator BaeS [Dyella caseinilytica]QRN53835.1 sensor histidine kinase efflux regulator BaeS [Dyella caseinilytica]GFZ89524.1 two-component sensor histidine kinase [Dyella caseinilytica]
MRPGLTAKLFLAMLAVAVFAVLSMGIAARLSFDRGFLGYLSEQETARMQNVAASLATAYKEHGSWQFLRDNPRAWFEVMRSIGAPGPLGEHPPGPPGNGPDRDFGMPPPDQGDQPPPGHPPSLPPQDRPRSFGRPDHAPGHGPAPPLPFSDLTGTGTRFALLDEDGRFLFGNPAMATSAHTVKFAVTVNGRAVGTLLMLPFREVTAIGDVRFLRGQYRASWIIGFAALLLAALLAIWLARTLLTPMHRITKATHALARGDYSSRVATQSQDELGQLARDFNRLAVVLERNESMRRAFVADVSHELRTPLAIIRGELEALEDGVRRFDGEALKSLQMEVAMLSKLIDDLYQLSLADLGSMTYRKIDLDLGKLLADTVDAFQERLRKAGITCELQLPPSPVTIHADESRLHQLFANLIENSLRYTDAGGRLCITFKPSGNSVDIDFKDSAPGVDEQNLSRLFERFYRVESSRNRISGGAGLGLAISRTIVEAHGGRIEAKPSPLGGLWLSIRLPLENT